MSNERLNPLLAGGGIVNEEISALNSGINALKASKTVPFAASTRGLVFDWFGDFSYLGAKTEMEALKMLLKYACQYHPNLTNTTFIGQFRYNQLYLAIFLVYDTSKVNENGLPEWAGGIAIHSAGGMRTLRFGTFEYVLKAGTISSTETLASTMDSFHKIDILDEK